MEDIFNYQLILTFKDFNFNLISFTAINHIDKYFTAYFF